MNRSKDWIDQAKRDLDRARLDIQYEFFEWACFTLQQSAEKSAKALCLKLGIDTWGHSITNIIKFLKEKIEISNELIESAQMLDTFYIPTRYPNGFSVGKPGDYYNRKIAMEALDAAEAILRFCEVYINQ
ncbi:HEPN domain-containing protein [bacterium]|nr:HEPN domain-containing protein [bacterium]